MKKLLFLSLVAGSVLFGFSLLVLASSPFDITFPIPELGDCTNQNSCKAYCDDSSHLEECTQFARQHNLLSEKDETRIKQFTELVGPGGCKGPKECRVYCEDLNNQDECFAFAEKHNLIPKKELERGRALSKQGGPGGCKSESECRAYCGDPSHAEECVDFAVKHGFLNKEDATRMKKLAVLGGPGGCKGKDECRAYCEDSAHQSECIAFAEENGFMTADEAARARKFAGKTGPGGCKGSECRNFCEKSENAQACLEFAEQEGLIPPEEAVRARKFLAVSEQGGPGGCKGVACRDYCEDPINQDECFAFAKGNGLLRPEDEKHFQAGKKLQQVVQESGGPGGCKNDQECRTYCADALHVEECVAFGATHGGIPEGQAREMLRQFTEQKFAGPGEFRRSDDFSRFEQDSQKRFEEFRQLEQQFRGPGTSGLPAGKAGFPGAKGFPQGSGFEQQEGAPSSGGFAGPGGCTSPAECIKYCAEHKDECFSFGPAGKPGVAPPEGGIPPGKEFTPRLQENLIREFKPEEIQQLQQFKSGEEKRDFFKQKFEEGEQRQFQTQQGGEKAAACAGEGGVWDGNTCRPPEPSTKFFPEEGFQQQETQTRTVQEQQIQQQIEQQMQQVQQLQRQQQQQQQTQPPAQFLPSSGGTFTPPPSLTPPPSFTPPPGGSIIDAFRSLSKPKTQ